MKDGGDFRERLGIFYKSPSEVAEGIRELKERINEVVGAFSVRELLLEMLCEDRARETIEWLYDLEALLGEAESAYARLGELKEELSSLETEMGVARCELRLKG